MAARPLCQVEIPRKTSTSPAYRLCHRRLVGWHDDQVDVIRHQAVSPNRQVFFHTVFPEKVKVQKVVSILEENLLARMTALRDVEGNAFRNDTGDA